MHMSYFTGEIKFEDRPVVILSRPPYSGLGRYKDVYGNLFDCRAIINNVIYLKPLWQLHPYYTDTSMTSYDSVMESWLGYRWYTRDALNRDM